MKCDVKGCEADRNEIDNVFCISCRKKWREVCDGMNIAKVNLNEEELARVLNDFKEKGKELQYETTTEKNNHKVQNIKPQTPKRPDGFV